MTTRTIHRAAARPHRLIAEALQSLIISELLSPGRRFLVASPWIRDVPMLDNRSGRFSALNATWGASIIRLSHVVRMLLEQQTTVYITYGTGQHNTDFLHRLQDDAKRDGTDTFLTIRRSPFDHHRLDHQKAIAGDDWIINGSMNLTYQGLELNGELVTVSTDPAYVAGITTELMSLFS